eukprot:1187825-Amphidinium_carterae.1
MGLDGEGFSAAGTASLTAGDPPDEEKACVDHLDPEENHSEDKEKLQTVQFASCLLRRELARKELMQGVKRGICPPFVKMRASTSSRPHGQGTKAKIENVYINGTKQDLTPV